jgi:hypothetical protein
MTTSLGTYVEIVASKDNWDIALLGKVRTWQRAINENVIGRLCDQLQVLQPKWIVVESTGDYEETVMFGFLFVAYRWRWSVLSRYNNMHESVGS